jgi:hypothetical protein
MATNNEQETLERILVELKSRDRARCLEALKELHGLKFSSPAILREIEWLAIHHIDEEVRKHALQSLGTSVHQFVRRNRNRLNHAERAFLLKQIAEWEQDGLLPSNMAEVIGSRYNFDTLTPALKPNSAPAAPNTTSQPPVPPQPALATGPRPTLIQTLLSEASIRIYLYLGAFFVIAAALILAAVVEAARLPILAVATLLFAGGALILRKRLPQPGFALFIVFSFLLPIDANVLEETIGLREPSLSIYWTVLFLTMALIWGFSVWFYESRFFSAVAFVSLSLAFYRAAEIFGAETELYFFQGMLASLAGLAGVLALKTWKDAKFSLFVFLLAQVQVAGLLFLSVASALIDVFNSDLPNRWWLLTALTWLTAASFFLLSDLLIPFVLFPWMAVAALLPLPWFFLSAFDVTQPAYAMGFLIWAAILALVSEVAQRFPSEKIQRYHWALLAGSVPLFLTSATIATDWGGRGLIFTVLVFPALVYGALHVLRPRWYVWSAALVSALLAFFAFFRIPFVEELGVPLVFQVWMAAMLLVVPELFIKSPFSLKSESRGPAIVLGVVVALFGILVALTDLENTGQGAIVLMIYAVLSTLHAVHSRREWLGYFGAALASLALLYALEHFRLDLWLPALTALLVIYFMAGLFLRRADDTKSWGNVLVNSGLTLGILLSFTSLVLSTDTSGWYMILFALLFAVEIFARPLAWFELAVETLLSMALYQILNALTPIHIGYFLFGASLAWLGGDLVFGRLIAEKRRHRSITLGAGYVLLAMSTFVVMGMSDHRVSALFFSLYTLFFAIYAFLQREPRLGYFATAFLSLAMFKFLGITQVETWVLPLISLAVLYYASGYWLRRNQNVQGWDQVLLYSGLGLGILTSMAAPVEGGVEASIPMAITATLFAAEAFALRNVWWGLPANAFYLASYFMLLWELNADEPQYYSIGAALLGMLTHYLLTYAGSKTGAFLAGMLSQLVLLGTTYIQMVSTERLSFFFVLFIQSMVVLVYGLIQRSRSLVITPIVFAVIGVMTVVYSALKGLGPVLLIGSTGVFLLMAGIVAVLMRERISRLGEQLSDWKP